MYLSSTRILLRQVVTLSQVSSRFTSLICFVSVAGFNVVIGKYFDSNDSFIAYLPLAHILEFVLEHVFLFLGVCIGYGSPRTLFDSEDSNGDLHELRQTYMAGVPAIWETARKSIVALIEASPPDEQGFFWETLNNKKIASEEDSTFPSDRKEAAFAKV